MPDRRILWGVSEAMNADGLDRLKSVLLSRAEVVWAYLFGSRARGDAGSGSDWDIAVRLAQDDAYARLAARLDLQSLLVEALNAPVDLVDLREASPLLCHEVLRGRILLVDREPAARAVWELRVTGEYLDWLPYHRRFARDLLRELKTKGGADRGRGCDGESPWLIAPIPEGTPGRTERRV